MNSRADKAFALDLSKRTSIIKPDYVINFKFVFIAVHPRR
jgi:hypothetical protein